MMKNMGVRRRLAMWFRLKMEISRRGDIEEDEVTEKTDVKSDTELLDIVRGVWRVGRTQWSEIYPRQIENLKIWDFWDREIHVRREGVDKISGLMIDQNTVEAVKIFLGQIHQLISVVLITNRLLQRISCKRKDIVLHWSLNKIQKGDLMREEIKDPVILTRSPSCVFTTFLCRSPHRRSSHWDDDTWVGSQLEEKHEDPWRRDQDPSSMSRIVGNMSSRGRIMTRDAVRYYKRVRSNIQIGSDQRESKLRSLEDKLTHD